MTSGPTYACVLPSLPAICPRWFPHISVLDNPLGRLADSTESQPLPTEVLTASSRSISWTEERENSCAEGTRSEEPAGLALRWLWDGLPWAWEMAGDEKAACPGAQDSRSGEHVCEATGLDFQRLLTDQCAGARKQKCSVCPSSTCPSLKH